MDILLVLPILIPFVSGIAMLLVRQRDAQRAMSAVGAGLLLASGLALLGAVQRGGVIATQIGSWPAPFGITMVADLFSAIMVVMVGVMGLTTAVYSLGSMDRAREHFGYYPLLHIMLMGVAGAFLTGDIFNLFVWFEVLLMASFVLMALGGERAQLEGAIKYVTLNLMSSALFLGAVGILYGTVGTLNMADLAVALPQLGQPGLTTTLAMLFLVAFGIKAAMFPLFAWLPASYHTPPIDMTIIFSGLLTKVGVYALVRVFTLIFVEDTGFTHTVILVLAGLTMVTGVLGAVAQMEVRRLLSFHIVSQIGYLLMGLGLSRPGDAATAPALAATVFFMVHVIVAKSALFMVSGAAQRVLGTYDLTRSGGLYRSAPLLALLFFVPALALAGMPPLSGFFAKLALVQAGLGLGQWAIVAVALAVSVLTLFSMVKIWAEAYWKPRPAGEPEAGPPPPRGAWAALLVPTATLGTLTVLLGVAAEPIYQLALQSAGQLVDPRAYIEAVQLTSIASMVR